MNLICQKLFYTYEHEKDFLNRRYRMNFMNSYNHRKENKIIRFSFLQLILVQFGRTLEFTYRKFYLFA